MKRFNIGNKSFFYLLLLSTIVVVYGGILYYYKVVSKSLEDFNNLLSNPSQEELVLGESIAVAIDSIISYTSYFLLFAILIFALLIVYVLIVHGRHYIKLYNLAHYNELTGAPNLTMFMKDAERLMKKHPEKTYVIVRFNIDRMSLLNEVYSYEIGDKILRCVTQALKKLIYKDNEAYGNEYGDRFLVLLEYISIKELNARKAVFEKHFYDCISEVIPNRIRFPIGWYILEKGENDLYSIIGKASFAHLIARQTKLSNNEIQCYDEKMKKAAMFENEVEDKMHIDLENNQFKVFFQPKFFTENGELASAEALVKWNLDSVDIPPGVFIPIFEKNGFVTKLDMYVYEQTCIFIKNLRTTKKRDIKISVNFSQNDIGSGNFVSQLCDIADKYGVPHDLLEVELTESVITENHGALVSVIDSLHKHGFTLAIDDFGSGYSSLGLLKDTLVDVVKFDRSFLENSNDTERAWQILESTVYMAKKLDIQVVAEGVESEDHLNKLKKIGCDIAQGFYYSEPITPDEFIDRFLS
jgi:EAL domain-containing protein (putative c-di-GMP-specific phosphodiesterase class I)/GGDEF domain-containing protein